MAKTILIVDDIAFVRKTLTEILQKAHYKIVGEAKDGDEAVKLFDQLRPDLVTMDIVMPQMSGIDAIRRIIQIDKNAKVVVISAMSQEPIVMEAINAGAKDYVQKPFSNTEILRTLERAALDENYVVNRSSANRKSI